MCVMPRKCVKEILIASWQTPLFEGFYDREDPNILEELAAQLRRRKEM